MFGTRQLLTQVSKTCDMSVPFLGPALIPVSSVKDSGIVLDSHLTFNEQVTCLTFSLLSTLCQISRVRHLFSRPVLLMILNSLVFSKLYYCSTVWAGTFKQNLQKLQLVQNFAARIVTNTKKFDHVTPVLRELQWPSVKSQLEVRDVTLLNKIINGLAPAYLANKIRKRSDAHSYSTRYKDQLQSPFCKTAPAQRSFFYRSINIWNSLCYSRNNESLSDFKINVRRELFSM